MRSTQAWLLVWTLVTAGCRNTPETARDGTSAAPAAEGSSGVMQGLGRHHHPIANHSTSIDSWKQAVASADRLSYDEPPVWFYPLRESQFREAWKNADVTVTIDAL
jgi:hypothetical protein